MYPYNCLCRLLIRQTTQSQCTLERLMTPMHRLQANASICRTQIKFFSSFVRRRDGWKCWWRTLPHQRSIRHFLRGPKDHVRGEAKAGPYGPYVPQQQGFGGMATWNSLTRPLLFTTGFGIFSFSAAAIWQYENMRQLYRKKFQKNFTDSLASFDVWKYITSNLDSESTRKAGNFRQEVNEFWNSLSEGQKVFAPILTFNLAVFAAWRLPALHPIMYRLFTTNPAVSKAGWPLILSAFSHYSFFHLAANMFVLHSFCQPIVSILGKEQFMGLYMTSAAFTSLCSHAVKIVRNSYGYSLGASGAICTILGTFGALVPDATMQILFLPFFTFTAASAIKGLVVIDSCGLLAGWKIFDHAAHLSGVLLGVWWCHYGNALIWEKRGYIMEWWHHNVRSGDSR